MNFTDQEIVNCALISLKHLRIMAAYAAEEAGTDELFKAENEVFEKLSGLQRSAYDFMVKEGWTKVTAQSAQAIEKSAKQLRKKVDELA